MDRLISLVQVEWFGLVPVTDEVDRIISVEVRRVCQQVDSSIQQRGGCGQLERTVDLVDDGDAGLLVQPHILLAAGGCGRAVRLRVVRMVAPMIILGATQVCSARRSQKSEARHDGTTATTGRRGREMRGRDAQPTCVSKPRLAGRWSVVM